MYFLKIIEIAAGVLGVVSVYWLIRGYYQSFALGLISTALMTFIYFYNLLYAQGSIHIYYSVLNIVGWLRWRKQDKAQRKEQTKPRLICDYAAWRARLFCLLLFFLLWYLFFKLLQYAQGVHILWDSLLTALSIIAMWLNIQKKIDAWVIWIVFDVLATYLFFSKPELSYIIALQYFLYTGLGVWGWRVWHRTYKNSLKTP